MTADRSNSVERVDGRWRRNLTVGLGVAIASAIYASSVLAGDWKLTDSTAISADYVDRSGANANSGLVLQLGPGFTLRGRGGRSEADVSYRLTGAVGTGDTNPRNLSHDLRARGRVELVDDFFFLGGNAAASLVGNSSTSGPVDAINASSDGSQSFAFEITPEFRQHLNRYADIVSLNRLNWVTYSGNGTGNDDSSGALLNLGVRSGRHFGATDWSLDATQKKTKYSSRTDTNTTYNAGLGYRIDPTWRVRGNLGYENNDVQTSRGDADGMTWKAGVDWSPNLRTTASADYGSRYFGKTYSAAVRHRSRRTSLALNLSHDITNRRSEQFYEALFVGIDPTTGAPVFYRGLALDQIDEDFVNTQLTATVGVNGRRTSMTVTGTVANRQYEVSSNDEDAYTISADVSRQLGNDYSATLGGALDQTKGGTSGNSDTYDLRLSLNKRVARDTTASLSLLHRDRNGSTGSDDYTENRIGLSIATSFLSR